MNPPVLGGVLCIDKGPNQTSFDVVSAVRRLYQTKQVGHTGTLDPQATGVLVVMVGRAVKAAEFLVADDKIYDARLQLGYTTDTQDAFGQVLTRADGPMPSRSDVEAAMAAFVGTVGQIPPMYSALKVNGQKLLDLARKGVEVPRAARAVTIESIELLDCDETQGWYDIRIACSKGTYIRTLCHDIGQALGCGAVMSALRRQKSGAFTLSGSLTLEELANMEEAQRMQALLPIESLFSDLKQVLLPPFFARLAHCGVSLYQKKLGITVQEKEYVCLCDEAGFFALGQAQMQDGQAMIKPVKQFRIE